MNLPGTFATTSIITKGLSNGPACIGMITTFFSLYCEQIQPPSVKKGDGGGPYPGKAWNVVEDITKFYKPVKSNPTVEQWLVAEPKTLIKFKAKLGAKTIERVYEVPQSRAGMALRIFKLLNTTHHQISITVGKIKRMASQAKISIKNIVRSKSNKNK